MKELSDKSKPQSLEELFRARMEAAETTPTERVWERIEQGLDLKEASYYKERVNWYRSLAAACVVLVMCAAMYLYYDLNTKHQANKSVATLPQNQNSPTVATNKPASPTTKISPPDKNIAGQSAEELTAQTKTNMPAQPELAAAKPTPKNTSKNSITADLLANQMGAKVNLDETYAAATPKDKIINQENLGTAANKFNTTIKDNTWQAAGKQVSVTAGESKILAVNRVAAHVLEPLLPKNAWAGLSQLTPSADSLWQPKAIVATPPMLAWEPSILPEAEEKPRLSRWSFSGKYAPQYFNQNLELASTAAPRYLTTPGAGNFSGAPAAQVNAIGYTEAMNEYDRNTTSGYSYNTAAAVGYALSEHWSLESGFIYTQNVADGKSSFVFNNSYLAARYNTAGPTAGLNDTKNISQAAALPVTALVASLAGQQNLNNSAVIQTPTFDIQYRYRSVGVPVKLNYQTTKNRKSFYFASVGLLTNLLVQAQILSESSRVPDVKFGSNPDSPFRTWQFATVLSAGKGFRVSKAISLKAGLEGTQYLTSLAAHPENLGAKQRKPYTIGLALSSSYTLGR